MTASDHTRFMAAIPLHIADDVARHLLTSFRHWCANSQALEGVALKELVNLQLFRVLPLGVPFSFIDEDCFVMVTGHLESALVSRSVPEVLQAHLINHSPDDLFTFGVTLASFSSWDFQKAILPGIQRQCHWVVAEDSVDVLPIRQSGCPFDMDLPTSFSSRTFTMSLCR